MNKTVKAILLILLVLIVGGVIAAWVMWHKPRRSVADEKGIEITAVQMVKEYQANEIEANRKYLDKAIQVSGTVTEVKSNQEGYPTVMLASDDPFAGGVFCTMKDKSVKADSGTSIVIKGICSGMLSDVRLRQAVIVK